MEAWQAVALALVALLVGALVPAVVQLTLALRSLRSAAVRAEQALVAITSTAERLDRLASRLEQGGRIDHLIEGIDSLSRTVSRLQETARVASAVGAAVGPAVGAAVRAWRTGRDDGAPAAEDAAAASAEPERKEEST